MKVLVIDDDMISRMALVDVINGCGNYRIVEVASGDEAWQQISGPGVPPMLVCCDIRMPGMSGIELLKKVRATPATQDIPFVLISMANDAETIKEAIQHGVSGYIVKPFSKKDARDRLSKALALSGSKVMEKPAETMARLRFEPDRYRAYLGTMQRQVTQLIGEIATLPNNDALPPIRERMAVLQTGCAPLGLWRAATLLQKFSAEGSASADMLDCLDELQQQLHHQLFAID